jgi:hypothetical protein
MTPECTLQVRSDADLLAAIPYMFGFHPTDSVVVVAFRGRTVVFAARQDLVLDDDHADPAAGQVAEVVLRQNVDGAMIIGYGERDRVTPTVRRVSEALRLAEVPVVDELRLTGGRYWSYRCEERGCCPAEGLPHRPEETAVAAAATFAGQVVLPDRAALVARIAPVTGAEQKAMADATVRAQERITELLSRDLHDAGLARSVRRAGRAAVRDAERRYRSGRRLDDDEVAWLGALLVDVAVRDYAWERIGIEDWCAVLWTDVVRRVEPEYVPAPACLLGFAAWRQGQGALAYAAVDRALAVDRDYVMAGLLAQILGLGLSPATVLGWPPSDRLDLGDIKPFMEPPPRRPAVPSPRSTGRAAGGGRNRRGSRRAV